MIIRRVSRSLAIASLIAPLGLAAAFVALGAAQTPEAPGDPLVAGFKSTYAGVGVGCGRARDRQERHDAPRHEAHDRSEPRGPRRHGAREARAGGRGHADAGDQALGRDDRRGEARRGGRHRHGRHAGHRRDGQSHGHGRRRTRHGRDGARRRDSRSLGRAPHGPDRLRAVQVAAYGRRPLRDRGQERPGRVRRASPSVRATSSSPTRTGSSWCRRNTPLQVLKQAQAIDDRERGMYSFIREFKSLQKAIAKFNRI